MSDKKFLVKSTETAVRHVTWEVMAKDEGEAERNWHRGKRYYVKEEDVDVLESEIMLIEEQ